MNSTPPDEQLPRGYTVDGRFEIIGALGRGGFALVYKARQINIDREVAIKVFNPRRGVSSDLLENFRKRFLQEAKSAARIHHPDIVTVHDYGLLEDGQPYIVMELLTGRDLRAELNARGPMPPKRAIPLFIRCLDALSVAHDQDTVHKDLKPSNLVLNGEGTMAESLRIVDFGIATMSDNTDSRLTTGEQYIGTPMYCVPEYYETRAVSAAHDVYQMGLILGEVLTGEPVVDLPTVAQSITAHLDGDLDFAKPLLDSPLGPVLRKATARHPALRYRDAAAFRDALSELDLEAIPDLRGEVSVMRTSSAPTVDQTEEPPTRDIAPPTLDAVGETGERTDPLRSGLNENGPGRGERPISITEVTDDDPLKDQAPKTRSYTWLAAAVVLVIIGVAIVFQTSRSDAPDNEKTAQASAPPAAASKPDVASETASTSAVAANGAGGSVDSTPPDPVVVEPEVDEPVVVEPTAAELEPPEEEPPAETVLRVQLRVTPSTATVSRIGTADPATRPASELLSFDLIADPPPWDLHIEAAKHHPRFVRVQRSPSGLAIKLGKKVDNALFWASETAALQPLEDGGYGFDLSLIPKKRRPDSRERTPFVD